MGKKPFSKRPSGLERSRIKSFENTAGIELKRIGGKKVIRKPKEVAEETQVEEKPYFETVLYSAPVLEIPLKVPEIKPSIGENFMRGLWNFLRGERA